MKTITVVGIDVSKHTLDYIYLPHGKADKVQNTPAGIASLIRTIRKIRPHIVALEATGGYQNALVEAGKSKAN